jgi:NTE family protein
MEKIGLVLGGGGARGVASIGIFKALEERNIKPDVIVGTSMGAMIGAFYANGYSAAQIHRIASKTSWLTVLDFAGTAGIMKGDRFDKWLREQLPANFTDLEKKFVVTAVDIDNGELLSIKEGDLPLAVRATCAFPGAFVPVELGGRNLVDGGLKSTVPVHILKDYDVDTVIACDFQPPVDRKVVDEGVVDNPLAALTRFWESVIFKRRNLAADVLLKAVDILQTDICHRQLAENPPDLLIRPPMPTINLEDFNSLEEIINAGYNEAVIKLDEAGW